MPPKRARLQERTMSTRNRPVADSEACVPSEPTASTSQGAPTLDQRVAALEVLLQGMSQQITQLVNVPPNVEREPVGTPNSVQNQTASANQGLLDQLQITPANQGLLAYEGSLMAYDGKMPWEEYLVHVEVTAESNGWTEERSGKRLASALKGAALTALTELPKADRTNYQAIVGALSSRFGLRQQATKLRMLLEKRKQAVGEGLVELAMDIEKLVRGAYPDDPKCYRDAKGVQSFLDAMRDTDLKKMLALTTPATIQEALTRAELAEALGSNQQTRGELRCWGCNRSGHTKSACPKSSQNRVDALEHPEN